MALTKVTKELIGDTDLTISGGTVDNSVIGGTTAAAGSFTTLSASSTLTLGGAAAKVAGKETIWIPATAIYPNTTDGCSELTQVALGSNKPDVKVLDFADGASKLAQFTVAFPKSWNEGTVTFQPFWMVTGTNTGTVAWGLTGRSVASTDPAAVAFPSHVLTTALAFTGTSNDVMVSAESGTLTITDAGVGTVTFFQIKRDHTADTQTGDARLLGLKLFFTTDAANDA